MIQLVFLVILFSAKLLMYNNCYLLKLSICYNTGTSTKYGDFLERSNDKYEVPSVYKWKRQEKKSINKNENIMKKRKSKKG